VARSHWQRWHDEYDDPTSPLSARLAEVQRQLRAVLDDAPEGPLQLISICAGRGRDVLDVVTDHPRGRDVRARLVELDPELAHDAALLASDRGLDDVEVVVADAARTSTYEDVVPANIVMICGVFGNISLDDIHHTVTTLPSLCADDARVIWTRHRRAPDRTFAIRGMFRESGFRELTFVAPDEYIFTVTTEQLQRSPDPFSPVDTMFTFSGNGAQPA
jgi:hypothetical protein